MAEPHIGYSVIVVIGGDRHMTLTKGETDRPGLSHWCYAAGGNHDP